MNEEYVGMDGATYEALYERFLRRDPKELLELAGMERGKSVLDLCSGPTYRLSRAALEIGASKVCLVDICLDLSVRDILGKDKTEVYVWDVARFLSRKGPKVKTFDIIVCQQGINYWWLDCPSPAENLAKLLNPGGIFIFNSFNTIPSQELKIIKYNSKPDEENRQDTIYESVQLVVRGDGRKLVHHVSMRPGYEPHLTSFDWIPPEVFVESLNASFSQIEKHTHMGTSIYVCGL